MRKGIFPSKGCVFVHGEIRKQLQDLAQVSYAKFAAGLLPGVENILGVRLPALRKIAKDIAAKEGWAGYLDSSDLLFFEEKMLQGMVIGYAEVSLAEKFPYIEKFVGEIDNWSVCDSFCSTLKASKEHREQMWACIEPRFLSEKEYEVRFAAVMSLSYFMEPAYIDRVLVCLQTARVEGYYAKMAIAWALSIAYVHFPAKTQICLEGQHFEKFIQNKAIQKIVESFRVSVAEKDYLKGWRIKK